VVGCWRGYRSGARCRLAYGPADATATHCLLTVSLLSLASVKSRLVLPFWCRLTRVVPEKGPLNGCMYVCMFVYFMWVSCQRHWRAGPAECSIYWGEIWCLRVRCNAGRSVKVSYWSSSSTAQTQRTAAQRCVQSPTVPATARQQGARLIFYPPTTIRCTNLTDTNVFKRHLKFYFFNHYFYM